MSRMTPNELGCCGLRRTASRGIEPLVHLEHPIFVAQGLHQRPLRHRFLDTATHGLTFATEPPHCASNSRLPGRTLARQFPGLLGIQPQAMHPPLRIHRGVLVLLPRAAENAAMAMQCCLRGCAPPGLRNWPDSMGDQQGFSSGPSLWSFAPVVLCLW